MKTVYIYALACPSSGEIRYIGKTQNLGTRLHAHISKAKIHQTSHYCSEWIRSLLSKGLRPVLVPLFTVPEGDAWQDHEQRLIREYKEAGARLTNLTGGGEGFYMADPQVIAKRVAAANVTRADPVWRAEFSKRLSAGMSTPEAKANKSRGLKSAWQDPEKRANFLAGMNTPEALARRSAASSARYPDKKVKVLLTEEQRDAIRREVASRPEVKEAKSKASKALWSDEEYRSNKLAQLQSEKFRDERSANISRRWEDPDAREKLMARWTEDRRAAAAASLESRREKMIVSPEGRERQKAAMREWWAAKKASKLQAS